MVEVCGEVTQVTAECSCYCTIMTVFQQTSCDCFIWLSFALFSIYLSNSTLSSTITGVGMVSITLYVTSQKIEQEGQHPLTGQRTVNFRMSFL